MDESDSEQEEKQYTYMKVDRSFIYMIRDKRIKDTYGRIYYYLWEMLII